MTCDVVPVYSVVIEVVKDGQTGLLGASLLQFAVIGLGLSDATSLRPIVLLTVGGGRQLLELSCPEPTVDVGRLQIGPLAATEIALAAARPNVLNLRGRKW